jgi:hypothetical protein
MQMDINVSEEHNDSSFMTDMCGVRYTLCYTDRLQQSWSFRTRVVSRNTRRSGRHPVHRSYWPGYNSISSRFAVSMTDYAPYSPPT